MFGFSLSRALNMRGALSRRAFTLIELLVVIAIISLLAAILFPVFARARENARKSSCLNNQKQIGVAFLQYCQDYDEFYPLTTMTSGAMTPTSSWTLHIQPYIKSTQVYRCPSDTGVHWATAVLPPNPPPYTTSYKLNAWMASTNVYGHLANLQKPAQTIFIADVTQALGGDHFHPFYWGNPPENTGSAFMNGATWDNAGSQTKEIALTRHLEGFNSGFADGHVKWLKWEQVWKSSAPTPAEKQGLFRPQ